MKEFLANLPVNFWLSYLIAAIGFISFCYVVYFYFSKEGKDERGRGIFASASAITFLLVILISLGYDFFVEGSVSFTAFTFLNTLKLSLMLISQSVLILVFRKIK